MSSPTRLRRASVAIAAAALAATLAPAAVAHDHPVLENDHFVGTYTHVEQDIGECLDLPFRLQHDGTYNSKVRFMLRGSPVGVLLRHRDGSGRRHQPHDRRDAARQLEPPGG